MRFLLIYLLALGSSFNAFSAPEEFIAAAREYYPNVRADWVQKYAVNGGTVEGVRRVGELTKGSRFFHPMLEFEGVVKDINVVKAFHDLLKVRGDNLETPWLWQSTGDNFFLSGFWRLGGTAEFLADILDYRKDFSLADTNFLLFASVHLHRQLPSLETWRAIRQMKDSRGEPLIREERDFGRAHYYNVDPTTAGQLVEDTAKPNAVYLLPRDDWNGAFTSEHDFGLHQALKRDYDLVTTIVSTEDEFCSVLRSTPNITLVVISGHGNSDSLSFSGTDARVHGRGRDEKTYLDTGDRSLAGCFENLTPTATIFLNSCSTAERRVFSTNLANFVWNLSGKKRVVASKTPFVFFELQNTRPLELAIFASRHDRSVNQVLVLPAQTRRRGR